MSCHFPLPSPPLIGATPGGGCMYVMVVGWRMENGEWRTENRRTGEPRTTQRVPDREPTTICNRQPTTNNGQ